MKAFVITAGTIFGLLVVAHAWRIAVEPQVAREPWFLAITAVSAILSIWAWRLVWQSRRA